MKDQEIRAKCLELMATAPAVFISVIGEDEFPRIRGMLNLRNRAQYPNHEHLYENHNRDFMVYITTNTSSRKHAEIKRNPRIGLYYSLPEKFLGLCLTGEAKIVGDMGIKRAVWVEGWERYYPETGAPGDPDYTLLRVLPSEASGWLAGMKFQFEISP